MDTLVSINTIFYSASSMACHEDTYDFEPLFTNIKNKMESPQDLLQPSACALSTEDAILKLEKAHVGHVEIVLHDFVLTPNDHTLQIARLGDVVLGVFVQKRGVFEVATKIGGSVVHKAPVRNVGLSLPNESLQDGLLLQDGFYSMLLNTFLPIIFLQYVETKLVFKRLPNESLQADNKSDISIRVAYGYLTWEDRKALAMSGVLVAESTDGAGVHFGCGTAFLAALQDGSNIVHLPRCYTFPCLEEKIEWQRTINKDLMQRTWHPERFMQWCLDTEEVQEMTQY